MMMRNKIKKIFSHLYYLSGMKRYLPLDILRGLTVALMIVVNNPGNWGAVFAPLLHSKWDGCTPTDLVFPTFMFCVGMAMAFSLARFDGLNGKSVWKILRRSALIFLLGLFLNAFPDFDLRHLRIFGVLQRIACCYLFGAILVLSLRKPSRLAVSAGALLVVYTAILLIFGDKGATLTLEGNFSTKVDVALFGADHIYHGYGIPFDPEGPLGILSATATVLLGYLTGLFVKSRNGQDAAQTVSSLFVMGLGAVVAGLVLSIWIPINKPLWSASYVLFCAGWAVVALAAIMYFTDVRGRTGMFEPARIFGTNALTAYFLSGILADCIGLTGWNREAVCTTELLSLLYAISFMLVLWCINLVLYKKKIFIKL